MNFSNKAVDEIFSMDRLKRDIPYKSATSLKRSFKCSKTTLKIATTKQQLLDKVEGNGIK